jgi:exopolysaccharide biosynthesis polyprenyl glycosylphosphotransferase
LVLVSLIWPFFFIVFSVYDGRRNETLKAELRNVFTASSVSMLALAGSLFFTYRETSRLALLFFFGLDIVMLFSSRCLLWVYRARFNGNSRSQHSRVLVIGAGRVGRRAAENLRRFAWSNIELIGFLDDDLHKSGQVFGGLPVLGTLDQIAGFAAQYSITDAVIALPMGAYENLVNVCSAMQKLSIHTHVIPDLFALSFPNAMLEGFGGIPAIDLGQPGITGWKRFWKRAFDLAVGGVGLVFISPILAVIALLIKLDSPGPVFYRQTRIGENGQTFTMLKFRSMYVGTDPGVHKDHVTRLITQNLKPEPLAGGKPGTLKLENDPRITRVGRILRKTSLDEFPQLINVLQGDMSLVGPRPPLAYEVELYKDWHKRRFEAPPGLTGLWQVKGRNRVSFDEMVRLDLEYIQNQSLWLDIKILLQTPWAIISTRGAG